MLLKAFLTTMVSILCRFDGGHAFVSTQPARHYSLVTSSSSSSIQRQKCALVHHHRSFVWKAPPTPSTPPPWFLHSSTNDDTGKVPSPSDDKVVDIVTKNGSNQLDEILSTLTSAFPFFVLGAATIALFRPSLLLWTNKGDLITVMLASVMWGTGLTLTKDDFTSCVKKDFAAVPAGVLCQFIIMPLTAYLVGKSLLLPSQPYGSALFLGLCLVGCSPGGTASNLVSLIAQADVALSVLLTSCSTILASVVTPLLVKTLVGSAIAVSGWTLCVATARVVLLPVLLGMVVNAKAPNLAGRISRFTPFCSVVLVSLICGGVVAENSALFLSQTATGLVPLLVASVMALHCVGFLAGYLVPRWGLRFGERTSRTISIETGMQNSALAVVLARSIGAPSIASLPGALSATVHSCLGSILAAYWRGVDRGRVKDGDDASLPPKEESPDDYPELVI